MAIEGAEAEAEEVYQEQPQESEVAEEDQELGTDLLTATILKASTGSS